ncbi:MAG: hypothetical protein NVS4B3_05990 [Gemmatimonadaceae bacterium]
MKPLGFRPRLFLILFLFAVVPSVTLTAAWGTAAQSVLGLVGSHAAWDSVAATGERAFAISRQLSLSPDQRRAWHAHEQELRASLTQSRRLQYILTEAVRVLLLVALLAALTVVLVASRVAGHLSRQLSRPIHELVGWTARIGRGERLPTGEPSRGAPEFAVLRERMRALALEIETGRARALEMERAHAFRETARRVAHELKNPLTPIRFAVARLQRDAPAELAETVGVLAAESRRLEVMARNFAQFGRLAEGPAADVDVADMVRHVARAAATPDVSVEVRAAEGLPLIHGHHDALARALANVVMNAVEACVGGGRVWIEVARSTQSGPDSVSIAVRDTGIGIAPDSLARIWEPYVTYKAEGTGLGLAIARQTILAHGGEVSAASKPGAGTEVCFVIPVNTGAFAQVLVPLAEQGG